MPYLRRPGRPAYARPIARRVALAALVLGIALVVVVSLVSGGQSSALMVADPVTLTLGGAEISSGYRGDLSTGASFSAVSVGPDSFVTTPPTIGAPSAILLNMDTGAVLFSHRADEHRALASTTKIMTALVALERLPLEQRVTVSFEAEATEESQVWLQEGEVLTTEELLYALLVGSANDAAVALAEAAAGSVEAFVSLMNQKAAELGLADTCFVNPHGLDAPGHYSSARDLATLTRYATENSQFRTLVATRTCTITGATPGSVRTLTNHNLLLDAGDWVTGVKTGFTDDAGFCLVASAHRDGVRVISVVLGEASKDVCWSESRALLEYGLAQCRQVTLLEKGTPVAEASIPYRTDETLRLVTGKAVTLSLSRGKEITVMVTVKEELTLPAPAGEAYGTLAVASGDKKLEEVPLVTDAACGKVTLGAKLRYFWDRLVR